MKKLTIVIVFYKQKIEESKTFLTLKESFFSRYSHNASDFEVILYDNSPAPQKIELEQYREYNINYIHDERNLGISVAYNFALETAKENGSKWMLLLDHDTQLTSEFIDTILEIEDLDTDIVSVVPVVYDKGRMISPVYSDSLRPLAVEMPTPGIQVRPVMAINSGSFFRTVFLDEIGGFNREFPLDYLDHWLFYEVNNRNKKVLLTDKKLEHELSVMNYNDVSLQRYKSILDSEIRFYKTYKKNLYRPYLTQLQKRIAKQLLLVKNKKIVLYTIKQLLKNRKG